MTDDQFNQIKERIEQLSGQVHQLQEAMRECAAEMQKTVKASVGELVSAVDALDK